ncbi:MAG: hypothetical protein NVS9B12_03400 [Vulcanimicrobiaceae bacterium]
MFRPLLFSVFFGSLALGATLPAAAADPVTKAPIRHLVYTFSVGIQTSMTVHDSGIGSSGSGVTDYKGGLSDTGTITVDVIAESADGGLVVAVSEAARNSRTSKPATCAVYSWNLSTICSADAGLNDEEIAIVRLVGRNFVSTAMTGPSSHWQVPGNVPDGSETNDFTVTGSQNGVLSISEQRVDKVRGASSFDATTNGTIAYNVAMTVPTALHELNIKRFIGGPNGQNTVQTYIDLKLTTDSMGAKP